MRPPFVSPRERFAAQNAMRFEIRRRGDVGRYVIEPCATLREAVRKAWADRRWLVYAVAQGKHEEFFIGMSVEWIALHDDGTFSYPSTTPQRRGDVSKSVEASNENSHKTAA